MTDASTKFTANGQSSTLASVTAGKSVEVIGQKQADGSWLATEVAISDRPPSVPAQGNDQNQNQPPGGQQQGNQPSGNQTQGNSPSGDQQTSNQYSLEQAMSDEAQLSTISFSGLAFITGSAGADTFFPPGKVADFFGFQYMRDVDTAGYGHNTLYLSRGLPITCSIY